MFEENYNEKFVIAVHIDGKIKFVFSRNAAVDCAELARIFYAKPTARRFFKKTIFADCNHHIIKLSECPNL